MLIIGKKIFLRLPSCGDVDIISKWENNKSIRKVSDPHFPFTKKQIKDFICTHQDIYVSRQLRLMICLTKNNKREPKCEKKILNPIGCIDLFDFDSYHLIAGIGILIAEKRYRGNGYASESLSLLIKHCFEKMNLRQLYCNISKNNEPSIKLFLKHNFKIIVNKKNRIRDRKKFTDEYLLQLVNK